VGQARLPVRKIREVLRLKAEGFSDRQIAAAIGSARSTVQECARRARDAGVTWPLPPPMDEAALHAMLYQRVVPLSRTPRPDFPYLHAELRRRGVTRLLLWEEYSKRLGKAPFSAPIAMQGYALIKRDRCTRAHYGAGGRYRSSASPNP
jgi:transposase